MRAAWSLLKRALLRLATLAGLASALSAAAAEPAGDAAAESRPAHVRLGFERIGLGGSETLGLLGTSYLVDVAPDFAIGPAVYGAVAGRRGGFFTYGAEAAWHAHLAGPLAIEIGAYLGGGGGGAAPQGGGLMLRPHADLLWHLGGPYALGVSLANVRFPNGRIDSTQLGVAFEVASDFALFPPSALTAARSAPGRSGAGFDRLQTLASVYRLQGRGERLDGSALPMHIVLLGARAEQRLADGAYWGLEANGAAGAGVAGYAEYLGSLAIEAPLGNGARVGTRVALGMGGGAGLPVGGGLLAKAAVYGRIALTRGLALSLEAGAMAAPRGALRAATLSGALVWALEPAPGAPPALPVRTDVGLAVDRFDARRRDGSSRVVTADALIVDRFVTPSLYVSGQVQSAVAGGAGGYSAALLGLGWSAPLTPRWQLGSEVLAGASGGGGIDSRGSVVQWNAYAGLRLTPALALRVGGGWLGSPHGGIGSAVVGIGITATYRVAAP
jgi:hypothetical protein